MIYIRNSKLSSFMQERCAQSVELVLLLSLYILNDTLWLSMIL